MPGRQCSSSMDTSRERSTSRETISRKIIGAWPACCRPPMTSRIIVYCSGGDCHDSRLVANALLSLGFSNVSVFTGGWDAWSAAGLPASTGSER